MTTSMILPQITQAMLGTSPLGAQLSMALAVTRTASPMKVVEALHVARRFAERHDFYLPTPNDLKAPDAFAEFEGATVPYFKRRMRPIFDKGIRTIAEGKEVYEGFKAQGLAKINLPDVAMEGLLTFDSTARLLESVDEDLGMLIDALPPNNPAVNPYFTRSSILKRGTFVGVLLAGGLILYGNAVAVVSASAGIAAAVEVVTYLRGKNARLDQIVANREQAAHVDDLKDAHLRVMMNCARLSDVRDRIPGELPHPGPISVEMRKAMVRERIGARRGSFDIVTDAEVLIPFIGMQMKYLAVEFSDGSREVRVVSPNIMHPFLKLEDEEVLGAGWLLYNADGPGGRSLRLDGKNQTFETSPERLAIVADILREVLGPGTDIALVESVFHL